ncbi:MAG TPA: RNA polymerase sigma factor RpoD/SigA [Candidatus Polarisedimenticolaceae bacterium]|nr:RNA polymerase sigma factor RpoD/SigA [Candidatus Polarisedimenticolaceae bacterium]
MVDGRRAENSVLSQYFSEIREYPLLTKDEEKNLARDIQNGKREALNELVESNLSFVAKVASEYRSLGLPFEDLLNEGNVGLIEAAKRFDASKDIKFISYAIWWIRKAILKALSEQSHTVRLPYSQMKKVKEIREAERMLRRELNRKPSREEISLHLAKSVSKIDKVLQHTAHEVSIDEPVGEEKETPMWECLVDDRGASPEERLLDRELTDGIEEVYEHLNDQQKTVIAHRFGLGGSPPLTLQETGDRMRLSRERVRQIECQAKERMRRIFRKMRSIDSPAKGGSRTSVRAPVRRPRR